MSESVEKTDQQRFAERRADRLGRMLVSPSVEYSLEGGVHVIRVRYEKVCDEVGFSDWKVLTVEMFKALYRKEEIRIEETVVETVAETEKKEEGAV